MSEGETLTALLAPWAPGRDLGARLAAGLVRRGVGHGQAVAWRLANDERGIALYRACWRLGAVAVPVSPRATDAELARLSQATGAVLTVTTADQVDALADSARHEPHDAETDQAAPDDVATVLFTAGSTGAPKGVRHTHRALAAKARLMVTVHGLGAGDVVLMPAPLSHVSGLLNGILVPAAAGMHTVLMDRWDPDRALSLIEGEGVSFMVGPPTFFVDLMDAESFAPQRVASLRLVSSGGAGVAPAFVARARRELGAVVKRSYGSTEAPTVATSGPDDDPDDAAHHDGHAIGAAELRVVAPDGELRPRGEAGELQVRGPGLFVGYLDPAQTAEAMTGDGWFCTGDLATIDPAGWLTITGRLKDVIIRAGENISSAEVEAVLAAHPDVSAAAVIGEPDERLGERAVAVVVAVPTFDLEECRRWFAAQRVARHKTPERVVLLEALPRLPAGKIDRQALRDLL